MLPLPLATRGLSVDMAENELLRSLTERLGVELAELLLVPDVLLLGVLLLLLHAASIPTERMATAVRANAFLENQGRSGLTPGPSFLLVQFRPLVRFG